MRTEYLGMSREQCSKEAMRLIERAQRDGNWLNIVDRLVDLRLTWYAPQIEKLMGHDQPNP